VQLNAESALIRPTLELMLKSACDVTGAEMGNIQLLERGALRIRAHYGFEQPFLEFFDSVSEGQAACGSALRNLRTIVVEDVQSSALFAGTPSLEILNGAHVGSVQSTPVFDSGGAVVGVISTHHRRPRSFRIGELLQIQLVAYRLSSLVEIARLSDYSQALKGHVAECERLVHHVRRRLADSRAARAYRIQI
jgi:GAF domain-containing protein